MPSASKPSTATPPGPAKVGTSSSVGWKQGVKASPGQAATAGPGGLLLWTGKGVCRLVVDDSAFVTAEVAARTMAAVRGVGQSKRVRRGNGGTGHLLLGVLVFLHYQIP
jgi:hypothetical protein